MIAAGMVITTGIDRNRGWEMLSRLETTYLGILRVFILVVATIALLVAIGAFISAVPALLRQAGVTHGAPPTGGSLGEYIAERKATLPQAEIGNVPVPAVGTGRNLDPSLSAAVRNIADYFRVANGGQVNVPKLEDSFVAQAADVPSAGQSAYYLDVKRLSEQLKASKGKPLTPEQVGDLFDWHKRRFVADLAAQDGKRLSDTGKSMLKLYVAGYAFAAFMSVIFTFLFVKIERSLRVVQVTRVESEHA